MSAKLNIIDRTFGRGFVFAEAPTRINPNGDKVRQSWVRCACGKEFIARNGELVSGHTVSCGCAKIKHGQCSREVRSRAYSAWDSMVQRCSNEHRKEAKNYVTRGIRLCGGLRDFQGFFSVLGECPPEKVLDRWPNNNGHYSCGKCDECVAQDWPLNVRWATYKESNRNTRRNRVFTVRGITGCMSDLAERFGIDPNTVFHRLQDGWEPERAFTQPVKRPLSSLRLPLPPPPSL